MSGESPMFGVPPPKFGRYRVQHQIGVGASGPVFQAEDQQTRASVAIKALRTHLPPEKTRLVVDELRLVIDRLPRHSSIVAIRAVGLEDWGPYFVSDLAPGEPLDEALKRFGPGAIVDVLPRLEAIAEGLDHAAEQGFCHGMLHPKDVMVSVDTTVVTGLAVASILAKAGAKIPFRRPYTAPELARGEAASNRSDQFSLAAIAFEWLFGHPIAGPAYSPLKMPVLPGVNGSALRDAFTTALATSPSARFESCLAFIDGIAAAVQESDRQSIATRVSDHGSDVELKPIEESQPEPTLEIPLPSTPASSSNSPAVAKLKNGRRGWGLAMTAMLLLGLVLGSGGSYVASRYFWPSIDQAPVTPVTVERPQEATSPSQASTPQTPGVSAATKVPPAAPGTRTPSERTPIAADTKKEARPPRAAVATRSPAQPAQPARPPSVETGSLFIESNPSGAAIRVNGMPRGTTPLTIGALPPGTYTVTMALPRFHPVSVNVRVTASERARASASLTPMEEQQKE